MRYFFHLITYLFITSYGYSKVSNEIHVKLDVAAPQLKVYIANPNIEHTKVSLEEYKELETILISDINKSGRLICERKHPYKEHLIKKKEQESFLKDPIWKEEGISYVIEITLEENRLKTKITSCEFEQSRNLKEIELIRSQEKDKRAIHEISNQIHKLLFNQDGIFHTQILYTVQTPILNPQKELKYQSVIWICDYDGGNQRPLTSEKIYAITPCFFQSKNKKPNEFLFVSYEKGPSKIFLSKLDQNLSTPFIELKGNQLLPAISADRSKIAFISDASGRADLFIQSIHPEKGLIGKPLQAYSFPSSVQASPCFSPDGKKIAFVSDKDKTPRIYIIDTPTYSSSRSIPNAECITHLNRDNTSPSWAPDGKKIAYSSLTNGIRQIWIYDFSTREENQLTFGKFHKENPCWAPDSLHIVFNTADTDSSDLFIIDLIEKTPIKITHGPGKKHYPCWSR